MDFKDFSNLVDIVNQSLGDFCNTFQYTRKRLLMASRASDSGRIFGNIKADNGWAINKGGGTQIQYHIAFSTNTKKIRYGLGFNTQYVPHANDMSTVEYIKPFTDSFISNKQKIKAILPNYDYVIGDEGMLINPVHNEYVLFGREFQATFNGQNYNLVDTDYEEIINDLKKQLEAFELVFNGISTQNKMIEKNREVVDIINYKNQIILQGPPGTGKTRQAKDLAELIIFGTISLDKSAQAQNLNDSQYFKIIQFHPSYSYEDFVRGITGTPIENGEGIIFKAENKILGAFAKEALKNYKLSKTGNSLVLLDDWIEETFDEFSGQILQSLEQQEFQLTKDITIFRVESDCFRYGKDWGFASRINFSDFKKLIKANIEGKFDINKKQIPKEISNHAHFRYTYYLALLRDFFSRYNYIPKSEDIAEEKYVLIIDEINRANLSAVFGELIYALEYRGEAVQSMYEVDSRELILPPNLYIIGTMNTADRSVGHIDYAMRRRFAFVDLLPEDLSRQGISEFNEPLFRKVSDLFISNYEEYFNSDKSPTRANTLSAEFRAEDVWLGHSYFIDKGYSGNMTTRLQYEIKPLLMEYVKDGILIHNEGQDKIEAMIKDLKV